MIVGYHPGTGLLHRAHPFTALALAGAVALLAFILPGPVGPSVLMAGVIFVVTLARLSRVLVTAAFLAVPMWAFAVLLHGFFGDDAARAVTLGARITAMIVMFLAVLAAVHPARLVDALLARGIPFSMAYLFSATLQAVPRLRQRGQQVLDAQRCRGLRFSGSMWRRARAVVPLAVPLVLGALSEVDQRAMALEARGAASPARRTPLEPPQDSTSDRVIRWLLLLVVVGSVVTRVIA